MALNDFRFLIVFSALLAIMFLFEVTKRKLNGKAASRAQIMLLLVFSYCFILYADWRFCVCIAVDTLVSYGSARIMECTTGSGIKRVSLCGGGSSPDASPGVF